MTPPISARPRPAAARGERWSADPDHGHADREAALAAFGDAFKGAMAAVRRLKGRETHHPGEMSYAQYGLLFGLAERGALPASELAHVADIAPGTASQMLDSLAAHGLIERTRGERDRRIVLVSLTPRGSEVVAARRAQYEPLWRGAFADFTEEELLTAAAVLQRTGGMFQRMLQDGTCEGEREGAPALPLSPYQRG